MNPTLDENGQKQCCKDARCTPCIPAEEVYVPFAATTRNVTFQLFTLCRFQSVEGFSCVDHWEFFHAIQGYPSEEKQSYSFYFFNSTGLKPERLARDPQFADRYISRVDAYYWTLIDDFATRVQLRAKATHPRLPNRVVLDDTVALMTGIMHNVNQRGMIGCANDIYLPTIYFSCWWDSLSPIQRLLLPRC